LAIARIAIVVDTELLPKSSRTMVIEFGHPPDELSHFPAVVQEISWRILVSFTVRIHNVTLVIFNPPCERLPLFVCVLCFPVSRSSAILPSITGRASELRE
jgi:hypothetical protein